jgi:hypothetical protein
VFNDEVTTSRIMYRLIPPKYEEDLQASTSRIPTKTRELVAAYDQILRQQDITHYFTLTAARRVSANLLRFKFSEWVDAIEWMQGRHLAWFRAEEYRWSGHGFPAIPLHFHGVLIGAQHLNIPQAQSFWRESAGDAKIDIYRPSGRAIQYCLKQVVHSSDYDLGGKAYRSLADGQIPVEPGGLAVSGLEVAA